MAFYINHWHSAGKMNAADARRQFIRIADGASNTIFFGHGQIGTLDYAARSQQHQHAAAAPGAVLSSGAVCYAWPTLRSHVRLREEGGTNSGKSAIYNDNRSLLASISAAKDRISPAINVFF